MKKTLTTLLLLVTLASQSAQPPNSVPARLVWNANTESDLVGYNVYKLTAPGVWSLVGNVPASPNPEFRITLDGTLQTYGVTATNAFFESDRATTNTPVKPGTPAGFQIISVQ